MASAKGILERVLGLQGNELPDDSSAQRLATEVYATMDVDGSGTLPRQDVYDFLIMQLGVRKQDIAGSIADGAMSDIHLLLIYVLWFSHVQPGVVL